MFESSSHDALGPRSNQAEVEIRVLDTHVAIRTAVS